MFIVDAHTHQHISVVDIHIILYIYAYMITHIYICVYMSMLLYSCGISCLLDLRCEAALQRVLCPQADDGQGIGRPLGVLFVLGTARDYDSEPGAGLSESKIRYTSDAYYIPYKNYIFV